MLLFCIDMVLHQLKVLPQFLEQHQLNVSSTLLLHGVSQPLPDSILLLIDVAIEGNRISRWQPVSSSVYFTNFSRKL
ncbi:hypothetical protein O6P43_031000 [Quillaja saponaria]|uniref:Uncharacterized protein n=1 Tax=Quillaja saponaria TaxID=32244 RepID=A0AAD7P8U7_QUISA|nr:hypothetical protein O6P43_031000 [Quillaja saponaria]